MSEVDGVELGPKMLACSERERKFVAAYLATEGNATEAARMAGFSDKGEACKVRGHELLQKSRVLEAIHELGSKTLAGLLVLAITKLREIASRSGPDQLKACLAILNRTGLTEKTTVEHVHTGVVEVSHTDAALESLQFMKSLNVPRETLVEHFGHSGLSRYEAMLAERDAKMKVIEHVG